MTAAQEGWSHSPVVITSVRPKDRNVRTKGSKASRRRWLPPARRASAHDGTHEGRKWLLA
jgi:hypothetical protein